MKNAAPSSFSSGGESSVQASKSMPTEPSAPGLSDGPSSPMVKKESYSHSGRMGQKAGLVGPTSEPNGAAAWKAGGRISGSFSSPNSA